MLRRSGIAPGIAVKLERQLEVSKEIPGKLDALRAELHRIGSRIDWHKPTKDQERDVREVMNGIIQIREKLEAEQIHVAEWMNMKAQQITMDAEKATCISCKQQWLQDHEFTEKEVKKVLKRINKGERYCKRCGQPLQQQRSP